MLLFLKMRQILIEEEKRIWKEVVDVQKGGGGWNKRIY